MPAPPPPSAAASAASPPLSGFVEADPRELAERVFARAVPADRLPAAIHGMAVTPALREAYAGHENLLAIRALHAPACYDAWDALRLCILGRVTEASACDAAAAAYRPCDEDLRRRAVARTLAREDERRRRLAAASREREAAPPPR